MEFTACKIGVKNTFDRRIIVTRAPHQALSFGNLLEASGFQVFYLPLIDIAPIAEASVPDAGECFDWVIFSSVNAVQYFQSALQQNGRSIKEYNTCSIAAIGDATAAAVKDHALHVDIIPDSHVSNRLVDVLLQQEPTPKGKRVLLPQGNLARPVIAKGLSKQGMEVCVYTVYETVTRDLSESDLAGVTEFGPNCVAFFSPSTVNAYVETGLRDALSQRQNVIIHASIGPVTTKALQKAHCAPIAESQRQNETSLRDTILEAFSKG